MSRCGDQSGEGATSGSADVISIVARCQENSRDCGNPEFYLFFYFGLLSSTQEKIASVDGATKELAARAMI